MKCIVLVASSSLLLAVTACAEPLMDPNVTSNGDDADDGGTGDDGGGSTSADGGDDMPDGDTGDGGDGGNVGNCGDGADPEQFYPPPGECYNNLGCSTCNCLTFRDNPPSADAVCADDPGGTMMRITATLLEFPGQTTIPNTELTIYNALDIGTVGPENATPIGMATANGDAQIDLTVEPKDQIGIVATVRADGFVDTATGLAKPPYEPSNAIHDLFAVKTSDAMAWSDELAKEAELAEFLPLGESGGVVGVARSRYTGEPIAGVVIRSLTPDLTKAKLRYLNEDGTFNTEATTSTGVYVLLDPNLAEEFEGVIDGEVLSTRANKAGSGAPAVFTMNLTMNVDPGSNPFE